MRINLKREILDVDNDELTSFFNVTEKIVLRKKQIGFIQRLDLTWDEEDVMESMYKRMCPFFGVDPNEIKKEVNIQANRKQTEEY